VRGVPARQIEAPVLRKIQVTINEGVAVFGDLGEKDADLTMLDLPGEPAIRCSDACGVLASCGDTALINDAHRERRWGIGTPSSFWGSERLAHKRAKFIAHAILIPGGP
jgi:hypothetical protein